MRANICQYLSLIKFNMLKDKKKEILKKKLVGIINNPNIENKKTFYRYIGRLLKQLPPGFSVPKRLDIYRYKDKKSDRLERKQHRKLDEIFKRKELV